MDAVLRAAASRSRLCQHTPQPRATCRSCVQRVRQPVTYPHVSPAVCSCGLLLRDSHIFVDRQLPQARMLRSLTALHTAPIAVRHIACAPEPSHQRRAVLLERLRRQARAQRRLRTPPIFPELAAPAAKHHGLRRAGRRLHVELAGHVVGFSRHGAGSRLRQRARLGRSPKEAGAGAAPWRRLARKPTAVRSLTRAALLTSGGGRSGPQRRGGDGIAAEARSA